MFLNQSIMEVKVNGNVTITVELGVKTLALLTGGMQSNATFIDKPKEEIEVLKKGFETETKDEVEDEKPAKEEKPKATRTRTKKEEPTVQEPIKEKEVEEEKPKTETKEKDEESGGITIEDLRKIQRRVSLGGGIEKMKEILNTFTTPEGKPANSASELKESDYGAYYEKLTELV